VAIYDVRQRASDLEEEAKQGARDAPRADQPAWKDVRREAATIRRNIPESVHVLQNADQTTANTGTGLSPNAYREDQAVQQPPTRLGEPNTAITAGRSLQQQEQTADTYLSRSDEKADQDRAAAEQGDREAQNRVAEYDAWKEIYGRMNPRDQMRERGLQDDYASRQQGMDDYVRDHPGFRVDENGDLYGDDVTPQEQRDMQRLMHERDRAGRRIEQSHRPYVQGRVQGRLGPR